MDTEEQQTEQQPTSWTLSPAELAATQERAAKINARATKRGFTGRLEVTGTPREISETDEAGLTRTRLVYDVQITGEAPSYNGWTFLAAVDTVETATGTDFILRTAPGVDESGVDRTALAAGRCEHCNTVRANRRYTYLVRHTETGEIRQVGSTCIKDFTGWAGRPVFIWADDVADELHEFLGGFASSGHEYTPKTVVTAAWAISRRFGWVPASATFSRSTRDLVSSYLYGTSRADRELRADVAADVAEAAGMGATIVTALLEGLTDAGDYVANLKVCLRAASVSHRHLGITVSTVAAYERMIGDRVQRQTAEKTRKESAYAGEIGQKLTITGTVTRLKPIEQNYGYTPTTSMLVIIESGTTVAKTFTAAAWAWDVAQGDEITITGTVKAHEEFNDTKETVLTRPKRIDPTA